MNPKDKKAARILERRVADIYRELGAVNVKHDIELAGNQIDVYVEIETAAQHRHCIAVEVKDWSKPVGVSVVNGFAPIVNLLRHERLIHEGIIVSTKGFSKQARKAAETYGLRLLEIADLTALVQDSSPSKFTRNLQEQEFDAQPMEMISILKPALVRSRPLFSRGEAIDYYLDLDLLQSDPVIIRSLAQQFTHRVRQAIQRLGGADRLAFIGDADDGGPLGAFGLLGILVAETGLHAIIVRLDGAVSRIRPHGVLQKDTRVVLITDVITGGWHILSAIAELKKHVEQRIFPVVALACRERHTADSLPNQGIELYPVYWPEDIAKVIQEHETDIAISNE